MSWVGKALSSSVGCKVLMAMTGIALVGFLLGHLAGNLLVFAGPEAINAYAEGLRDFPVLLWMLRLGLILAFFLHVASGLRLTVLNRRARPVVYRVKKQVRAGCASRYMALSGAVVLGFIGWHLAHLTFRATHPAFASLDEFDVYSMLMISFKEPVLAVSYIVCIFFLMIHLSHGISALFQTLGLNHKRYNGLICCLGPGLSTLLGLGFSSIPLAILLGILR